MASAVSQFVSSLTMFFVNLFFFRELGLADYGAFSVVFVLVNIFSTLHSAIVLQPLLALDDGGKGDFFYNSIKFINLCSIFSLSLIAVFTYCFFYEGASFFLVLFLFCSISVKEFIRKSFSSSKISDRVVLFDLACSVMMFLCVVLVFDVSAVDDAVLAMSVAYAVPSIIFLKHITPNMKFVGKNEVVRILSYSRWIFKATAISMLGVASLPLFLGAFLGVDAVGVYRSIQNLFGMSNVLMQFYEAWMQPRLRGYKAEKIGSSVDQVQVFNISFMIVFSCVLFILHKDIFYFLYGDELVSSDYYSQSVVQFCYWVSAVSVILVVEKIRAKLLMVPEIIFKASLFSAFFMVCAYGIFFYVGSLPVVLFLSFVSTLSGLIYLTAMVRVKV